MKILKKLKGGFGALKRLATPKCFEGMKTFIELMLAAIGVIVLLRQTTIMDAQTKLFERQTAVSEDQREMATRPDIRTKVLGQADSPDRTGPWVIGNSGEYGVKNLNINFLCFQKFENRGWTVSSFSRRAESIRTWVRSDMVSSSRRAWDVRF